MKEKHWETPLYQVHKNVVCLKCNHKGAIEFYCNWFANGLGSKVDEFGLSKPLMEKYRDNPKMSYAIGFGGTIPAECTNCGNIGLIDFGGLEGYEQAFRTVLPQREYD